MSPIHKSEQNSHDVDKYMSIKLDFNKASCYQGLSLHDTFSNKDKERLP